MVKADGLAAGKGVVVAATVEEAEAAVDAMLIDAVFGAAGVHRIMHARMFVNMGQSGLDLSVSVGVGMHWRMGIAFAQLAEPIGVAVAAVPCAECTGSDFPVQNFALCGVHFRRRFISAHVPGVRSVSHPDPCCRVS